MVVENIQAVSILTLKKDVLKILQVLQLRGFFHVEQQQLTTNIQNHHTIEQLDSVAKALLLVKWLQQHLDIRDTSSKMEFSGLPVEQIIAQAFRIHADIHTTASTLVHDKAILEKELIELENRCSFCNTIPFDIPSVQYQGAYSFYTIVQIPSHIFDTAADLFKTLSHVHELSIEIRKDWALITGPISSGTKTLAQLATLGFITHSIPISQTSHIDAKTYPSKIISKKHDFAEICESLAQLRIEYTHDIQQLLHDLKVYHARFVIGADMHATEHTCVLQGFVVSRDVPKLASLEKVAPVVIDVQKSLVGPTKLYNLPYIRSYELITRMFGLPTIGKTDPTVVMSLFIPIFFGVMFSDIGYGLVLLLTSIGLMILGTKGSSSDLRHASIILGVCAIMTILFGFLFGSFFGTLIPMTPLLFDPFQNAQYLLIASLVIGIIHLNLAHVIGMYEYIKDRNWKSILESTGSFVTLELGIALLFIHKRIAFILIALSIALFIKKNSLQGLIDVTGLFGTWFSYARILALSLATGGIALGVNIMAKELGALGVLGVLLGIILLVVGHAFNYILNLLGCTIHSVRLHFVEFFSQYYEPKGKEFKAYDIYIRG